MREKISKISLFTALVACVTTVPSDARVNVKTPGRSYADAYNQVAAMRYQQDYMNANAPATATTASAAGNLPVAVDDENLANAILNNSSETTIADLESCSMIYPNGVFRWAVPESGIRRNQTPQCVAVVELRKNDGSANGLVLATTTVAAGDSFKCNIENFPESGMNVNLVEKTEFPRDEAPTMEDVEKQMNEEQKQNAGMKIITGAIMGGIAGNLLAPKQAGDTKAMGGGKTRIIDTMIGTTAGAGIMTASTYSGKVAGDTIKSTAVNAASGMVIGNMMAGMAGGDSIVATTKCAITQPNGSSVEHDCVIGNYSINAGCGDIENGAAKLKDDGETCDEDNDANNNETFYFFYKKGGGVFRCKKNNDNTQVKFKNCKNTQLFQYADIKCNIQNTATKTETTKLCSSMGNSEYPDTDAYVLEDGTSDRLRKADNGGVAQYFLIASAQRTTGSKHAYAIFNSPLPISSKKLVWDGVDGLSKRSDIKYYYRNSDGTVGAEIQYDSAKGRFDPSSRDASDGGIVDLSNKARTKGTLVGAATGGAMGGLAGYEGAKSEIAERWIVAVDEYTNSLMGFFCATGGRFLSKYNDYVEISPMQQSGQ